MLSLFTHTKRSFLDNTLKENWFQVRSQTKRKSLIMIRLALAQINPIVGDLTGNQKKILEYIQKSKEFQADMVIFPELAVCGYPPEDLLHKDHFVKDNIKILESLKRESLGSTVIIGFVDMDKKGNLYNAAAVIGQGQIKGVYYKQELPNYGVFDEKRYFKSGDKDLVFSCGATPLAINICEDIWVEKSVCQRQARKGARLLINISSSPYDADKLERRLALLKRRAKETKSFIAYLNCVGGQDELVFDGSSLVVDPKGKILASGKDFEEDLVVVDLNIPLMSKPRKDFIPIGQPSKISKRSIAPHFAGNLNTLERIYKALVVGTRDYLQKNGFAKAVIGLSGGIDSALVAAIAVDAIGKENVVGVTMPSRYTSSGTNADAKQLAQNLGIKILEIPIEGIFKAYSEALSGSFANLSVDIAEENIQARIRGNLLMALSNKLGWLVLTTGNKSEIAVGYCTLYGDMSGGFSVIKDVPKTIVYKLAQLVNEQKERVIPQTIIDRAPTAELKENQKDQDTLPAYDILDEILKEYVEEHHSIAKMSQKRPQDLVKKIVHMVDRSEYKRRQAAPGVKITPRAFGKDWRLPITNKYRES